MLVSLVELDRFVDTHHLADFFGFIGSVDRDQAWHGQLTAQARHCDRQNRFVNQCFKVVTKGGKDDECITLSHLIYLVIIVIGILEVSVAHRAKQSSALPT
ncbi:hypothetical protein D3C76_1482980 [compost metagenome]